MKTSKEPRGTDGWLGFFWFGLVFFTPVALIASVRMAAETEGPKAMTIAIAVALAGYSVLTGIRLKRTVKPARTFLKVMMALSCVAMLTDLTSRKVGGLFEAAWGLTFQVIWLVYLYRSVRVRNTYPSDFGIASTPAPETSTLGNDAPNSDLPAPQSEGNAGPVTRRRSMLTAIQGLPPQL
jgi:hypothetical protein